MIELKHLGKIYSSASGSVEALKDVNLTIADGEIFGIIGLSGAGKSTLVRCINLLERPTSGEVLVDGQNIMTLSQKELLQVRRQIGMIFQGFNLLEQRTVLRNICFPLEIAGVKRDKAQARAEELLELVEMEVRETLSFYGFPGDDTPIIRGSALNALASESTDPKAPEYACIEELMQAVDTWIPTPDRKADQPFLMPVEDVFTISGRGTVATGRVERGVIKKNEPVEIVGLSDEKKSTVVTDIEMFHKLMDYAEAGDNIGALLRGIDKKSIERGQVLSKPGSIHPHTKFVGQVYVLSKDEGGRHTPFFNNYRPQFYFRTTDVTGIISLPEGVEMCMPGDNIDMKVELITPIAIEKGLRFAIREGGRTVGSGVVIECKD